MNSRSSVTATAIAAHIVEVTVCYQRSKLAVRFERDAHSICSEETSEGMESDGEEGRGSGGRNQVTHAEHMVQASYKYVGIYNCSEGRGQACGGLVNKYGCTWGKVQHV